MLELIETAERTVCLEGYIFRRDEVGQQFADALIAAAQRGLNVRLLVDWIGRMGTPHSFFQTMARSGVEVRIFNPPDSTAGWASFRVITGSCSWSTTALGSPEALGSGASGRPAFSNDAAHRGATPRS
jgi:phosphatidylserine/phosphatidylglycerophosphate/cardiolipin synthase-like enzyme